MVVVPFIVALRPPGVDQGALGVEVRLLLGSEAECLVEHAETGSATSGRIVRDAAVDDHSSL
jgi:hypothetical protein